MPISLTLVLALHVVGMMFTIFLHSNFKFQSDKRTFYLLNTYTEYHSKHHMYGNYNFGFSAKIWDKLFKTEYSKAD